VTGPDLFLPPQSAADPPTVVVAPARRRGLGRRRTVIGSAMLAVLVAGGLVVALLLSGGGAAGATAALNSPAAFDGASVDVDQAAGAPDVALLAGGRQRDGRIRLGDDTLLIGKLVSTGAGTLVVAQDNGPNLTVRTDDRTRVIGAGKKGLAALAAGDRVAVRVSGTGGAATAVTVRAPTAHVIGTVTALSGDTATILGASGLSQSVNIAALNPKPAVGDLIVLSGNPDGSTLTANRVRTLPKAS
jgi:hypothetical protein